jgi:hypothetical protein
MKTWASKVLIGVLIFSAFSLVLADPAAKLTSTYRGWLELMGTNYSLLEMDKQPGLALSKDQAKKLLPVLKDLAKRENLRPKEATGISNQLADIGGGTPKQQQYLETISKSHNQAIDKARASGGQPDLPFVRINFAMFGMVQAKQPYNPFKAGPGEDDLKKLSILLETR